MVTTEANGNSGLRHFDGGRTGNLTIFLASRGDSRSGNFLMTNVVHVRIEVQKPQASHQEQSAPGIVVVYV